VLERPFRNKWKFFDQIGYRPRKGQKLLHWAADYYRFIGYYAYPRAGKSYGAAMEVAATVAQPDHHCWIIAPTYSLGSKEFGYIYQAHNEAGWLKRAKHVSFNIQGGDMRIEYPWGWFCEVKSAERANLLLAEELDEMILAEAARLPETIWHRSLFNRAEKRKGRVFVPTTPAGLNWIHTEFWNRAQKEMFGEPNPDYDREYWAVRISHLIEEKELPNVCFQGDVYDTDTIDRARRQMPAQLFREQFGGDFVSYAGLVYPRDYDPLVAPFDIPESWRVVIGYDHGASGRQGGNTAITFWAYAPTHPRRVYLFDLIYTHGHGAAWYAAEIRRKLTLANGLMRPYDAIVVDASANQVRIELALAGLITTTPPVRGFKDRYTVMKNLLEMKLLYVFEKVDTKPFMYELDRYEWKEGAKGEARGDMVRGPDDSMDSSGYAFLYRIPNASIEEQMTMTAGAHSATPIDTYSARNWEQWHHAQAELIDDDAMILDRDVAIMQGDYEEAF
jgi:hypothetical protein